MHAQKNDEKLVEIHNLYFEIHSFLKYDPGMILTNSRLFEELTLPKGNEVKSWLEINDDN